MKMEKPKTRTYKGTLQNDKSSKRYKCFKIIEKHYGCLGNFLDEIEYKESSNNK